jgi:hypothetical protein
MSTATDLPAQAPGEEIFPASRNRNEFSENLGTEMTLEQIAEKLKTQEGKMEVLQMIKDVNPELNGNVEKAGDIVKLNTEQLLMKESFIKKMLKLPGRAMDKTWETVKKHPVLTAVLLVAIAAAGAYYMGYLPQLGTWGLKLKSLFTGAAGSAAAEGAGEVAAEGAAEAVAEGAGAAAEAASEFAVEGIDSLKIVLDENAVRIGEKVMDLETFASEAVKMKEANPDLLFDVLRSADTRVTDEFMFGDIMEKIGMENVRDFDFSGIAENIK